MNAWLDPAVVMLKPLYHSSQKLTRKLAEIAFKYCDWMKVLAASLRVGFCDEWKSLNSYKAYFYLAIFFGRTSKSECYWVVMSSVFVTSQSSFFFLCSREQIRLSENRLLKGCLENVGRYTDGKTGHQRKGEKLLSHSLAVQTIV